MGGRRIADCFLALRCSGASWNMTALCTNWALWRSGGPNRTRLVPANANWAAFRPGNANWALLVSCGDCWLANDAIGAWLGLLTSTGWTGL